MKKVKSAAIVAFVKALSTMVDAQSLTSLTDSNIHQAVKDWHDPTKTNDVQNIYGPIEDWNVVGVSDMNNLFRNLVSDADLSSWDVSGAISMYAMFYKSTFNGDISSWNVSGVTSMDYMFHSSTFNSDISSWNVSGVTSMYAMFGLSKSIDILQLSKTG